MSRVEIDLDALKEVILHLPGTEQAMTDVAESLADDIRALTPVSTKTPTEHSTASEPGEFAASITVVHDPDQPGSATVAALSPKFHWVEFGTGMRETREGAARGEMPAFAPFRKAAEATGKYVPEGDGGAQ